MYNQSLGKLSAFMFKVCVPSIPEHNGLDATPLADSGIKG